MTDDLKLTPTRPYLARAIYQWICDHHLTPYLLVDATQPRVSVPAQHIHNGQIVLNIAPHAVGNFHMDNDAIFFSARFGGVAQDLYVPMSAVMGLYSRENGQGLFFDASEYDTIESTEDHHILESDKSIEDRQVENVDSTSKRPSFKLLD